MVSLQKQFLIISVLGGLWLPSFAISATLPITVQDDKGKVVKNAVVYAEAVKSAQNVGAANQKAIIDQVDKEFIPYVSSFKVGTKAYFPNNDKIRHHVYSFSPAKKFEIPLYEGTPADPIVFDKPGVVVLGCNIHDWMSSYVFVSATPYFSLTEADGKATISNLPPGDYDVQVWHPRLKESGKTSNQRISIEKDGSKSLLFVVKLKRLWRPRRAPAKSFGRY
jgi:plastocyanin